MAIVVVIAEQVTKFPEQLNGLMHVVSLLQSRGVVELELYPIPLVRSLRFFSSGVTLRSSHLVRLRHLLKLPVPHASWNEDVLVRGVQHGRLDPAFFGEGAERRHRRVGVSLAHEMSMGAHRAVAASESPFLCRRYSKGQENA